MQTKSSNGGKNAIPFWNCEKYMELVLFVDSNDTVLRNKYLDAAANHNSNVSSSPFPDAGFDLFAPFDNLFVIGMSRLSFGVKCAATMVCENGKCFATGFYMYPRSSLSKTQLRLANSVGIIDSGYRGPLVGAFDCLTGTYKVQQYDKLVQICAPGLVPVYVRVVFDEAELGGETERGEGGFGSTGR